MSSAQAPATPAGERLPYVVAGSLILCGALGGLFYYKWGGALRTLAKVRGAGVWSGTADALTSGGTFAQGLFYFHRIWIALVYGLLVGAAVCAFVSPRRIAALLSSGPPLRRQVAGGLAGAPLMLCSCCVTPIFQSVYEQGARLGSALSLMLASPGLNPAALLLTFILFPAPLALARLGAALLVVFGLPSLLERGAGTSLVVPIGAGTLAAEPPSSGGDVLLRYLRALGYLALRTIPLVVVGVAISSVIVPVFANFSKAGAAIVVLVVATGAVLAALPTFFEIPLALVFLKLGLPGAAVALLIAGPIVNLPSLLILARETRPRVALGLALGVWTLAVGAGLLFSL